MSGDLPTPDQLIGRTEADAKALCRTSGVPYRVTQRNGHFLTVTRDYVADRVNMTVAGGVVTTVAFG